MGICQGCGGVLGRDCWNQEDCMMISRQMQDERHYDAYEQLMKQPLLQTLVEIVRYKFRRKFPKKRPPTNDDDIPF